MKRLIAVLAVSFAMAFGVAACEPADDLGSPGLDPGVEETLAPIETLEPIGS
jgi:hypothetical protein